MTARLLDGKPIAGAIKSEIAAELSTWESQRLAPPCIAVVRIGTDPASETYVTTKIKTAAELGIISEQHHRSDDISQDELRSLVVQLNCRDDVDAILVQLPLPAHIEPRFVLEAIDPAKDVDGFHPLNVGRMSLGYPSLVPCTPAGVIEILRRSDVQIAGRHAVIVGRSNIVGKPLSMLLLRENATVTICHSRTGSLSDVTKQADILVAAIGRSGFIQAEHIKEGATVIDVGINKVDSTSAARELFDENHIETRLTAIATRGYTLVGDVNQRDALKRAANFTPVPGGVGLLTVAMLMKNTLLAAKVRRTVN